MIFFAHHHSVPFPVGRLMVMEMERPSNLSGGGDAQCLVVAHIQRHFAINVTSYDSPYSLNWVATDRSFELSLSLSLRPT